MTIRKLFSPNFNDRRDGLKPCMIILHYSGTPTAQEAEDVWMTPDQVAPHYMIDGTGAVTQYVEEDKRAWHAGKGRWGEYTDINSASIGIEIWNSGHEYDFEDFLDIQISTCIDLITDIRTRHFIPDHHILAHSDTAAGRKIDPGEKFPWAALSAAGIGLMPDITDEDRALGTEWLDEPDQILAALHRYGYDPEVDGETLIQAFRRHFMPYTLMSWGADVEMCAALASLLRQKNYNSVP